MPAFESAWRATKGARSYQEDSTIVSSGSGTLDSVPAQLEPGRLVAVMADGMGGHTGGAIASATICRSFMDSFAAEPMVTMPARLQVALEAANDAIARAIAENPSLSGMGSTLVGAAFGPDGLEWVSVGDSPLYLYRSGELALLNEDHSLAPALDRLAEEGRISAEQARSDPRRHMLRSAVTGEDIELVDISRKPLPLTIGDYVILASDGIHTLESSEITRIVKAYGSDGPDAVATAIIREVENVRDPYQDNTTVVVIRPVIDAGA